MIGKLKGVVDGIGAEEALVDVNGVVYVVACGARTLAKMPVRGDDVTLHIETVVREDLIRLYGFATEDDRAWFVRLQSIQGVGAKVALAILDALEPPELLAAANAENKDAVAQAKGVGPRVAARVVAELKGKAGPQTRYGVPASFVSAANGAGVSAVKPANGRGPREDAVSALVNLGVVESDARSAVLNAHADTPDAPVGHLVKAALRELGR